MYFTISDPLKQSPFLQRASFSPTKQYILGSFPLFHLSTLLTYSRMLNYRSTHHSKPKGLGLWKNEASARQLRKGWMLNLQEEEPWRKGRGGWWARHEVGLGWKQWRGGRNMKWGAGEGEVTVIHRAWDNLRHCMEVASLLLMMARVAVQRRCLNTAATTDRLDR